MAQLNDLLVLGDTNLQGDVVSQGNVTAPKFIGALQGNANTATALTSNAGNANTPIYFTNGKPKACSYTLAKSVPADAKFTDTVYTLPAATSSALGGVKIGSNITLSSGTISLTKANVTSALGYTPPTTDTDTGATSVEVTGSGSAVTAASYDAATRKLTLTKGSTFNNYSLPTATTSALGGVKAGATITSSSGYTACPILNGVLYYKDTKYTLSSFDITATATELNYTDGVTSNIQTQLNNKLPLSGGTVTGNILFSNSSGQSGQPNLKWKTIKNNEKKDRTPFIGYCTASSDGTFMVGSLEGTSYTTGLAIGGSSGNLLWKGKAVATTDQIPTSLKNPNSLTVRGNGTQSFTYDGSTAKTLNIKAGTNTSVTSDTSGNITIAATDTTYTAGTGLTLSGTDFRVTASDASEIMNQLSEGSSPALPDDYLIAQYAGGGSTTKTYHRRKVKNIITGENVKAALGTGTETTKFLRNDGTWQVPTDSHGNDIAQTYLTVQSHDLNPTEAGKFFCGKKNSIIYVDLSVSYISIYISKDFGKTWTHLSNPNYTYDSGTYHGNYIYQYAPGSNIRSNVLIYNLSYNNRYYYTIINPDTATLEFKVQKYLLEGHSSSKVLWQSCAMGYGGTIAAVHSTADGNHYIGLIDSRSNTLLCGYEKTGAANYTVSYIGINESESSTTRKLYYYFFCDFDDMTANKQRIYRIAHTYTYSSGADAYSTSTITSGYSSYLYMYKLVQVGLNSFVYSPIVFADYDYAGQDYYYTTVGSVTNGTYAAITLPEKLTNIQIIPLVFDQTFIISGIGGGGEPIHFLVDLKSSSYTDPYGNIYEQATGIYTPVRTSLNVPWCYHGITPINNGEYLISHAYNTTIKSIVGKWYVGSENYYYARTQKNEIYCNGTKLGEFYQ